MDRAPHIRAYADLLWEAPPDLVAHGADAIVLGHQGETAAVSPAKARLMRYPNGAAQHL